MPRLDFEKQFARQLKDRGLQPSGDSWEKLQGRLELEEKKTSPLFWWMGIAASLAGAVFILNFVFNDPIAEVPKAIVDTEIKNVQGTPELEPKTVPQVVVEEPEEIFEKESIAESSAEPSGIGVSETADFNNAPSIVESETFNPETGPGESPEITEAEIDALLTEAIAEVSKEMPEAGEITDAQIDALLADARAEVKKERLLYQTASFDAENLLLEVETELEHSFREQVFELIRDGLQKTRNAVVNINE